jgi:asparagine synthase (glutamine-hydrolysing)
VDFTPEREVCRRYYDLAAMPPVERGRIEDHVAEAGQLFTEATRASLAGGERPAVMLSGGLDSALVATKVLELSPADRTIDAYCFVPGADWDGLEAPGRYGDERPLVEDLARMHPRLRPQFFDNPELQLDDDFTAMFEAIGAAPINLVNLGAYHPMWRAAKAAGCDRILVGEFGNTTLSNSGDWGFSELLTGLRWSALARSLRGAIDDDRPLWRRFIGSAVLPLLPDPVWRWQREVRGGLDIYAAASPLRRDYAEASGALERAAAAGVPVRRHPLRNRMADFIAIHHEAWGELSDIEHGFGQIYGIEQRDPMAWRPLLEYCAGLPTELFLNGGQSRWLARELGKGILPDSIRLNRRRGLHHADWHSRIGRQRGRLLALLGAMERVPRLAAMIDFARIRPALENWPACSAIPDRDRLTLQAALPRAILLGRFVAWAEGIALE